MTDTPQRMKTPLKIVTGLGSAKEGTAHFWQQRLTGLAAIPLSLFLIWLLIALQGTDQAGAKALFANPIAPTLGVLAMAMMGWHMKIGMQVVIEDYVHSETLKLLAVLANTFFSILLTVLGVIVVLKLSF